MMNLKVKNLFLTVALVLTTAVSWAGDTASLLRLAQNYLNTGKVNVSRDYQELESEMQTALRKDPQLKNAAPQRAMSNAEIYLTDGLYQEAIWTLEDGGLYREAEILSSMMEKHFQSGSVRWGEKVGDGVSGSVFGTVGNIKVILKPADSGVDDSVSNEVFTYKLDRALGLNLVPVAIKRNINGVPYSIHVFMHSSRNSGLNFRDHGYEREYPEIYLLDFMIEQKDRHFANSMISPNGKLFAIDHGRIYGTDLYDIEFNDMKPNMVPNNNVLSHLKRVKVAQVEKLLSDYPYPEALQFMMSRLKMIQKILPQPLKAAKLRPAKAEERLAGFDLNKPLSKKEQQKLEAQARAEEKAKLKEFTVAMASLRKLKVVGENDYIEKNDVKLTENGHAVFEVLQLGRSHGIESARNSMAPLLIELYEKKIVGYRDFRRLFTELLEGPIDGDFVKLVAAKAATVAPLQAMFVNEEFKKKYLKPKKSSQFLENYKLLLKTLDGLGLSCKFAYY